MSIEQIKARLLAITPAPWYSVYADDEDSMNCMFVTTTDYGNTHKDIDDIDTDSIVCCTLYQTNPYIIHSSGKWDENTEFIAHAPEDMKYLLELVELLQSEVKELQQKLVDLTRGV